MPADQMIRPPNLRAALRVAAENIKRRPILDAQDRAVLAMLRKAYRETTAQLRQK